MATYYVDDGGNNTTGADWTNAYHSFYDLVTAVGALGAGDIVYVGADSADNHTYAADLTIQGSTAGNAPAQLISATVGTTTYAIASADQIDTTNASTYQVAFDRNISVRGLQVNSGERIAFNSTNDCMTFAQDCLLKIGDNDDLFLGNNTGAYHVFENCTFNYASDAGSRSTRCMTLGGRVELIDCDLASASNRTGPIIQTLNNSVYTVVSGCDLTAASNASADFFTTNVKQGLSIFTNCKMPASTTWYATNTWRGGQLRIVACDNGNKPEHLIVTDGRGELYSDTGQYRTGGATVEGTNYSWGGPTDGIETTAECTEWSPFYSPWIPFAITSTGSKTFTVYIQGSSGDLTDSDIQLQVEVKADSSSGEWTLYKDSAIAVDSGSTWNVSETNKQKLVISSKTVNTTGLARARIAFFETSKIAADDLFVDPTVEVTT